MCLYTQSVWRGAVHSTPANRPILVAICCRQPEHLPETAAARGSQVSEGSRPTRGGHCRGHVACPPGMLPTHFKAPAHEKGCEKLLAAFFPSRDRWEECHCPWPLGNRYDSQLSQGLRRNASNIPRWEKIYRQLFSEGMSPETPGLNPPARRPRRRKRTL